MKNKVSILTLSALILGELFAPVGVMARVKRRNAGTVAANAKRVKGVLTTTEFDALDNIASTSTVKQEDGTVVIDHNDGTKTFITYKNGVEIDRVRKKVDENGNDVPLTAEEAMAIFYKDSLEKNQMQAVAAGELQAINENVMAAVTKVRSECSGIAEDIDTVKGWAVATGVSSGLGALAAGGAFVVGLKKDSLDDEVMDNQLPDPEYLTVKKTAESGQSLDAVRKLYKEDTGYGVNGDKTLVDAISSIKGDILTIDENNKWIYVVVDRFDNIYDGYMGKTEYDTPIVKEGDADGIGAEIDVPALRNRAGLFKTNVIDATAAGTGGNLQIRVLQNRRDYQKYDFFKPGMANATLTEYIESAKSKKDGVNSNKNEESETLGNVRTGLMIGATGTSLVSSVTSLVSSGKANKLGERLQACNRQINVLKGVKTQYEEIDGGKDTANYKFISDVIGKCESFDVDNMKSVSGVMVASGVTSIVGTVAGGVGVGTSIAANSEETRKKAMAGDEDAKKKVKTNNVLANVMAGITTGTSATSTILSGVAINKVIKDADMAKECFEVLDNYESYTGGTLNESGRIVRPSTNIGSTTANVANEASTPEAPATDSGTVQHDE